MLFPHMLQAFMLGSALAQTTEAAPTAAPPAAAPVPERLGGALGLGVALGAPCGLTGRFWMGEGSALQFSAGGRLGTPGTLGATVDYVVVLRPFDVSDDAYTIPIHVGAGFKADVDVMNELALVGPRAVGGASLLVPDLPTEFFVEVAPTFYFLEQISWSVDGQMGVRYYF